MNLFSVLVLSLVQGVTEWLPVSSSGHLVLVGSLLQVQSDILFDTVLHLASVCTVLVVFRTRVRAIADSLVHWNTGDVNFRLFWYVVIATIPIALAGFFFRSWIEHVFSSTLLVGVFLLITGTVLFISKFGVPHRPLTLSSSLFIGIAQVPALLPGISRSGMTLSSSSLLGLDRQAAVDFSFLLFIPAGIGAALLQFSSSSSIDWGSSLIGFFFTFLVGVVALKWLKGIVLKGKLHHFSWYCWFVGILTLLL